MLGKAGVEMESRKRVLTSPGSTKQSNNTFVTPPSKKLKQARLPFQPLTSSPATQINASSDRPSKKRKLSETVSNPTTPLQINKSKDKNNVALSSKPSAAKKTPAKRAVRQPDPDPPAVEVEVTSSSEDATKSPARKKKPKALEHFLQATEQPTSTSDEENTVLTKNKLIEIGEGLDEAKDQKSPSPNQAVIIIIEDSNDGCKEVAVATTSVDATSRADATTSVDTATIADATTSVDAPTIVDATSRADATTSVDTATIADATTSVDAATVADATTKADATTSVDAAIVADATTIANATSIAVATTSLDATTLVDATISIHDQIDAIDSASDDGSVDNSVLDSSTASDEANTSIESTDSLTSAIKLRKSAGSSQVAVVSTPKSAPRPSKKTPMSAKTCQKQQELEQKRLEKEKLREEKRQQAELDKAEKKKLKDAARAEKEAKAAEAKLLKELEKEQKQKERQEKLDREEKERLEKKALREEKLLQKMKEQEAKEEEKRKKEEEKKKVEEEKNQKENLKRQIASKQKNMFKSFFKKIDTPVAAKEAEETYCGGFCPFQVQKDMALAPVYGFDKLKNADAQREFESIIKSQNVNHLYLDQLKKTEIVPGKRGRTQLHPTDNMINENSEDSVQLLNDAISKMKTTKTKAKLLQFHENYRPAYFGTWTKRSTTVSARNFLKKDEAMLDYEFDSDEEWEEPGESLSNSEGEDSDSDGGDDSDNDGFFVEHGYLSESEDPLDEDETVEQWREKRAAKALAWEVDCKRQTQVLKPTIVGCFWVQGSGNQSRASQIKLESFKAVTLGQVPIETSHSARTSPKVAVPEDASPSTPASSGGLQTKCVKKPVPEEAMPHLIRLVHGNTIGIKALIREFRDYWRLHTGPGTPQMSTPSPTTDSESSASTDIRESPKPTLSDPGTISPSLLGRASPDTQSSTPTSNVAGDVSSTNSTPDEPEIEHAISKRQLEMKIMKIAMREKRIDTYSRICWYVHKQILEQYNVTDLPVPCLWQHRTGHLAPRLANSPLPGHSVVLPPQKFVSAPAVATRRIVPKKIGGSPSVMSLLQQQKTMQQEGSSPVTGNNLMKAGQVQLPALSGASGLLAAAASMCSAQQASSLISSASNSISGNPPAIQNLLVSGIPTVQPPAQTSVVIPGLLEANQSQTAASQAATSEATKTGIKEVLPKPAKNVITLNKFFGAATKKPDVQDKTTASLETDHIQTVQNPLKTDNGNRMEVEKVASPVVTCGVVEKENNKMEAEKVASPVVSSGLVDKKDELIVIKDLLSQAKEKRLKMQQCRRQEAALTHNKVAGDIVSEEVDIITID